MIRNAEHFFSSTYWPYKDFLYKNVYLYSLPIFFSIRLLLFTYILPLSSMTSSYILNIDSFSDRCYANIFSHLVGCLLIFLIIPFAVQKLS